MLHGIVLKVLQVIYEQRVRPWLFRYMTAQQAHDTVIDLLRYTDDHNAVQGFLKLAQPVISPRAQAVHETMHSSLPSIPILAAGFVKGDGFAAEHEALAAVQAGYNIIPGWRTMPLLVGPVEFGSYTRYPRIGNPGTVIWRNEAKVSTQNRVGLKNPGAVAAAEFLGMHLPDLPKQFGINLAVSPGVSNPEQELAEIIESAEAFVSRGVRPGWFTLNLSCPNTEDDPSGNQTTAKAIRLCTALQQLIAPVPLWVKIGPDLSVPQYHGLLSAFESCAVSAVVATNTLAKPAPDGSGNMAGVGGKDVHAAALRAVQILSEEKANQAYSIAIIGCGGMLTGEAKVAFARHGAIAMQYYSALVYRGPFAAAIIQFEARKILP
jgi:dihydroorotate dehydrogenase